MKRVSVHLPSRASDSKTVPLLNSWMSQWKLEYGQLAIPHEI